LELWKVPNLRQMEGGATFQHSSIPHRLRDGSRGAETPVVKVPLGGGSTVTLASALHAPWDLAVDSEYVYLSDYGRSCQTGYCDGAIVKVPVNGGAATTLASPMEPTGIAVDATSVYWLSDSGVTRLTPK
jgi:hypothetical protein